MPNENTWITPAIGFNLEDANYNDNLCRMKTLLKCLLTFLLLIQIASAQSKKDNTIKITGVTFREVVISLLDFGYIIEKSDSVFQTIKTEYKIGKANNKWMKLSLFVRIKDSVATVTGKWYNTFMVGAFTNFTTIDEEAMPIEFASVNPKACFNEMKDFSLSFKRPIEFIKN